MICDYNFYCLRLFGELLLIIGELSSKTIRVFFFLAERGKRSSKDKGHTIFGVVERGPEGLPGKKRAAYFRKDDGRAFNSSTNKGKHCSDAAIALHLGVNSKPAG